ncbi:uncharacterized protein LOC110839745 [Zootermopsis nevadensis]|uniref:uncharacterized protein LOC110839745 n=1 Tax=Zootermopsis nevadensis TaxID=136037 RepID=UPI000B8E2836|nr:uncharacterized protein LOC110839745 [Zootermopsis nevadensis]
MSPSSGCSPLGAAIFVVKHWDLMNPGSVPVGRESVFPLRDAETTTFRVYLDSILFHTKRYEITFATSTIPCFQPISCWQESGLRRGPWPLERCSRRIESHSWHGRASDFLVLCCPV